MMEPKKTGWRYRIRPFGSLMYAIGSAGLTTAAIWPLYPTFRPRAMLLIFVGFCVVFFFVWNWVFYERPAELDKKLPISSRELRRRKKEFYDSLPR
jgi:hypothetical protein